MYPTVTRSKDGHSNFINAGVSEAPDQILNGIEQMRNPTCKALTGSLSRRRDKGNGGGSAKRLSEQKAAADAEALRPQILGLLFFDSWAQLSLALLLDEQEKRLHLPFKCMIHV